MLLFLPFIVAYLAISKIGGLYGQEDFCFQGDKLPPLFSFPTWPASLTASVKTIGKVVLCKVSHSLFVCLGTLQFGLLLYDQTPCLFLHLTDSRTFCLALNDRSGKSDAASIMNIAKRCPEISIFIF